MEDFVVSIADEVKRLPGDYAWGIMALMIFGYDMYAIKFKRCDTMSTAIWKSLAHPKKAVPTAVAWGILTHHLFANKQARESYSIHIKKKKAGANK